MKAFNLVPALTENLSGDRIRLPPSILNELINEQVESPWTFALTSSNAKTYASVREFTSSDGTIELNARTLSNLQSPTDVIKVELVKLPKCTHVTLKPLTADYVHIKDHRATLEAYLRTNFTVLHKNETLSVPFDNFSSSGLAEMKIAEMKPEDACLCIDTDLEVDIEASVPITREEKLNWIGRDKLEITDETESDSHYQIPLYPDKLERTYDIEVDCVEGDCALYVSDLYENPGPSNYSVCSLELKTLKVSVDLLVTDERSCFFIGVAAFESKAKFKVTISTKPKLQSKPDLMPTKVEEMEVDGVKCSNCHSIVPQHTITMHTVYCQRNNVYCNQCQRVYLQKDFKDHWHCLDCSFVGKSEIKNKHTSLYHAQIQCSCGLNLVFADIPAHKRDQCEDRKIICRFCHLFVRAGKLSQTSKDLYLGSGLTEHESECGARTITCQKCSKSVQLKDIQTHFKIHELQNQSKVYKLCSNQVCGNLLSDQFPNMMDLCSTCFKPFYSPRHDPNNQKLIQNIIKTYHQQLTVGCQLPFCSNEYCCTSTNNSYISEPMNPNESALKSLDLLKTGFPKKSFHFCVQDEKCAKRRLVAQELHLSTKKKFDACIAALANTADDLNLAQQWLNKNA